MTFRELLKGYKDGTLANEERLLVEHELEKSEAINDYLAEEIEKSIGLEDDRDYDTSNKKNLNYNENIVREINKTVNRRLAAVIGASVACVLVIFLVIQYVISPLVSQNYYNPTAKTGGQKYHKDLSFDLRAITEVSMPGYAISSIYDAEALGFGKYNLIYTRKNLFTKEKVTINAQIRRNMRIGTFEDFYPDMYTAFSEFWNDEEGSKEYQKSLEIRKNLSRAEIEHVKKLPATSYISAWARFSEDLNMEELFSVKNEYSKIDFRWIAVRTNEKQGQQLMGFSTGTNDGFVSGDVVDVEKYPAFQIVDYMSNYEKLPNIYDMHFKSLLRYLVDHKEATYALVGDSNGYDYESALAYVEEKGISTYGALIYGEAEDLIKLYESGTIMTFEIDNVIASKYIK